MKKGLRNHKCSQTGAALIFSLVMLLVMTVLGVAAMQTNLLEEKMAGNYRDYDIAFQAAESALRDAEIDIISSGRISRLTNFTNDCTNGLCDATSGFSDVWKDVTKEPNGVTLGTYTSSGSLTIVACQPRYWIEGFQSWPAGSPSWKARYRITAVGCGGNANTRVVLQEVFAR